MTERPGAMNERPGAMTVFNLRQAATQTWYQWAASLRRLRAGWQIFVQNRIAVAGLLLLILFGLFPLFYLGLRATVWELAAVYDPIYGFDMQIAPHPAPPSWIPADWLAPDNVHRFDQNRPSWAHPLGTDTLGRDILSNLLASTVTSFIVGVTAALVTAMIGVTFAALSAYYRGLVDGFLTHISDAFLLLPPPIFMLAVGVFLQSERTVFTEIVYRSITGDGLSDNAKLLLEPLEFGILYGIIAGAGGAAIVLRSHGLKVRAMSFVEASIVSGAGARHIIRRHLIPHMVPLAGVYMLVAVTGAVVSYSFLAFFGLNPNPLNWGTMIYNAFAYSGINGSDPWFTLTPPALAISTFAGSFYMISRGIHQVVEPRLRPLEQAE